MGSVSIDCSVEALWKAWLLFARGKRRTSAFEQFFYHLETNLRLLSEEIGGGALLSWFLCNVHGA
jgi:hypothetical protein